MSLSLCSVIYLIFVCLFADLFFPVFVYLIFMCDALQVVVFRYAIIIIAVAVGAAAPLLLLLLLLLFTVLCMYGHIYSKSMDRPSKVANLARGLLNREK